MLSCRRRGQLFICCASPAVSASSELIIVANVILEWPPQHVEQSTDCAHLTGSDTAAGWGTQPQGGGPAQGRPASEAENGTQPCAWCPPTRTDTSGVLMACLAQFRAPSVPQGTCVLGSTPWR